jgi:hypothetical protein
MQRMLQAGVILSDYGTLMVEILKDNARPEAGAVSVLARSGSRGSGHRLLPAAEKADCF